MLILPSLMDPTLTNVDPTMAVPTLTAAARGDGAESDCCFDRGSGCCRQSYLAGGRRHCRAWPVQSPRPPGPVRGGGSPSRGAAADGGRRARGRRAPPCCGRPLSLTPSRRHAVGLAAALPPPNSSWWLHTQRTRMDRLRDTRRNQRAAAHRLS